MRNTDTPKDGDFASQLERTTRSPAEPASPVPDPGNEARPQTIDDVLEGGQEPTDELLEEFRVLNEAPPLSDEELEQQALDDPGEDGDVSTPE